MARYSLHEVGEALARCTYHREGYRTYGDVGLSLEKNEQALCLLAAVVDMLGKIQQNITHLRLEHADLRDAVIRMDEREVSDPVADGLLAHYNRGYYLTDEMIDRFRAMSPRAMKVLQKLVGTPICEITFEKARSVKGCGVMTAEEIAHAIANYGEILKMSGR